MSESARVSNEKQLPDGMQNREKRSGRYGCENDINFEHSGLDKYYKKGLKILCRTLPPVRLPNIISRYRGRN